VKVEVAYLFNQSEILIRTNFVQKGVKMEKMGGRRRGAAIVSIYAGHEKKKTWQPASHSGGGLVNE